MVKTVILSLGGSLIVPDEIDVTYLRAFKRTITRFQKTHRFIIIPGGGMTARRYMSAARALGVKGDAVDWVGIRTIESNAELLSCVFNAPVISAYEKIPNEPIVILIGGRPGHSSDYDAVLAAKQLGISCILNLTNQDYVYDKDPKKYKGARPFKILSWSTYQQLIGRKWTAGAHVPFDPISTKLAKKFKITVANINGRKLDNLSRLLQGKMFTGTVIG